MLPVCSATRCSSNSQILLNDGVRCLTRTQKVFGIQCVSVDTTIPSLSGGVCPGACLQKEAASSLSYDFHGGHKTLLDGWNYTTGRMSASFFRGGQHLTYVEDSSALVSQEQLGDNLVNSADILLESSSEGPVSILDRVADSTSNVPDTSGITAEPLPSSSSSFMNILSQTNESTRASFGEGENALNSSVDKINSTISDIVKDGNQVIENLTTKVLSSFDQAGELTKSKLSSLPSNLKESSSKAGIVALELLRKTIFVVEDSLVKGSKFVYYSYDTSKELLPPEIQNALKLFEEKATQISRPVGMVFLQVYSAIEGLERSLGLDPSDPIVPFILFVGTTSTLWAVYWLVTYSGYAGDLSPELAFELVSGKESAVLVDTRPEARNRFFLAFSYSTEDLRQRDGIPDLRRSARSRYADVSMPKIDSSLRKLMKSSRDLDDTLTAVVIRDLKNVKDRSKIIVMDADGSHAKGIARSLRKLGVKRPYVLQGGFKSWVKNGLRAKELKPETAISILNEEAEAILEELNPTPVQVLGVIVGSVASFYALLAYITVNTVINLLCNLLRGHYVVSEWEKTLQLIGIIGLGQTIYRRVTSYEDSEDFKNDVSLLLSPVKLGAQAISQATGKLETNGNGLPVSPSSLDIQNRVLQAAAKHESQPFDIEESQDSLLNSTTAVDENVGQSEA
uniref:Rhodanese domain-containing protein n=1 Tax=Chenopodium quinoa TaxID=63459 RepID=A0A803KTQ5_CHEQI